MCEMECERSVLLDTQSVLFFLFFSVAIVDSKFQIY
jgi:hypothetical protein